MPYNSYAKIDSYDVPWVHSLLVIISWFFTHSDLSSMGRMRDLISSVYLLQNLLLLMILLRMRNNFSAFVAVYRICVFIIGVSWMNTSYRRELPVALLVIIRFDIRTNAILSWRSIVKDINTAQIIVTSLLDLRQQYSVVLFYLLVVNEILCFIFLIL
jgi:hypothetical protein